MDWTPVLTAGISALAALVGAGVGFASTQIAASRNRAADRRKRSTDRLVDSTLRLETAYVRYTKSSSAGAPGSDEQLELEVATRAYDRAVALTDQTWIRTHATAYADKLRTYYLFYGTERDELDSDRQIPTVDDLSKASKRLADKLRGYEK